MEDLFQRSIGELSDGLRAKEFSSVELTKDFLRRCEEYEDLNSFISLNPELTLKQAQIADTLLANGHQGRLCGVPLALKDLIVTTDFPTTCGSKILGQYLSPYDASCVSKLRSAGSVILGKTNMDEFAMGSSNENSAYGSVKNPWNRKCVSGGSSGGSAAAVAAGLAPIALGSDTGGSVRQPASFCGISGLKPTYGRVSRYGLVAYASSLDQIGPLARSVEDLAILSEVIFGYDPADSTSANREVPAFSAALNSDISGKRIGIPAEYFNSALNPEIRGAIEVAIQQFESLGASIVDISLPHTEAAVATYYIIAPAEASSNLARFDGLRYGNRAEADSLFDSYCKSRSEGFGTEVKRRIMIGTYVLSQGYYDAYYLQAQKVRSLIARDFQLAFENDCDLIACPTTPSTAFEIGQKTDDPLQMYLSDIYTVPLNLAGLPGLSIPCGFDSKGLPIGMQLIAGAWQEQLLLNAGFAFQKHTDWHLRLPTLEVSQG